MHKKISDAIERLLDTLAEGKQVWHPEWIANAVVQRFTEARLNEDQDVVWYEFYRHCAYKTVRAMVAKAIRGRTDPTDASPDQLVFEDFPRVQEYYTVTRNSEWVGVPVLGLTDVEAIGKIAELRRTGYALLEHADQLELFLRKYA